MYMHTHTLLPHFVSDFIKERSIEHLLVLCRKLKKYEKEKERKGRKRDKEERKERRNVKEKNC